MSKAAWLTLEPMSGSGDASVTNTGTIHTGREQRETVVTGTATGVSSNKTYKVIQKAKSEFVSFNETTAVVSKVGGTVTILGKSNSAKLTFALVELSDDAETTGTVEGGLVLNLPNTYTAGGATTDNGVAITGDPGADQEYEFTITFTGIAANNSIDKLTAALMVTADGGQTAQVAIEQTAGDAYFNFETDTIMMEADGSPVSINITSNTQWSLA